MSQPAPTVGEQILQTLQALTKSVGQLGNKLEKLEEKSRSRSRTPKTPRSRKCTVDWTTVPTLEELDKMPFADLFKLAVACGISPQVGGSARRKRTDISKEIDAHRITHFAHINDATPQTTPFVTPPPEGASSTPQSEFQNLTAEQFFQAPDSVIRDLLDAREKAKKKLQFK
eukprot:PhF_6_TR35453/c0_g1_i1/m.51735